MVLHIAHLRHEITISRLWVLFLFFWRIVFFLGLAKMSDPVSLIPAISDQILQSFSDPTKVHMFLIKISSSELQQKCFVYINNFWVLFQKNISWASIKNALQITLPLHMFKSQQQYTFHFHVLSHLNFIAFFSMFTDNLQITEIKNGIHFRTLSHENLNSKWATSENAS